MTWFSGLRMDYSERRPEKANRPELYVNSSSWNLTEILKNVKIILVGAC